jgi:hypothetical protein
VSGFHSTNTITKRASPKTVPATAPALRAAAMNSVVWLVDKALAQKGEAKIAFLSGAGFDRRRNLTDPGAL